MANLQPLDIVVYEGQEREEYRGRVGITVRLWKRNGFPTETAWEVEWLYPLASGDALWVYERNLRKLGEVPNG